MSQDEIRKGYVYAVIAYLGWGFFPIYWKLLLGVPAIEILAHRILWGFVFYFIILSLRVRRLALFFPKSKKEMLLLFMGSIFLCGNWFVYVYAVNSGQIIESSLGYFINPLVNIAVGVSFLKERLSRLQQMAVLLATIGVCTITYSKGTLPWIALFLAASFSSYGLIKRHVTMTGERSNLFETTLLLPWAVVFLFFWILQGNSAVVTPEFSIHSGKLLLLIGGGVITGLPLIFFAEAAKRIPFYMLGFFQFLSPTFQFLSGVVLFHEPLSPITFVGFIFIWLAGIMVIVNNLIIKRKTPK